MKKDSTEAIVIIAVVFALYLLVCAMVGWYDRQHGTRPAPVKPAKYDERQLADQATAYKVAFLTVVLYDTAYILAKEFGLIWCEDIFGFGAGAIAAMGVFTVICVQRDAFFRVGKTAQAESASALICTICGTCNLLMVFAGRLTAEDIVTADGIIGNKALVLVILLYLLLLDVILTVYLCRMKKLKAEGA